MDSLDAVPSAEYASLLTLSVPNDVPQEAIHFDRNQNLNKPNQEHIYAQVTPNGHCLPVPPESSNPDRTLDTKVKDMANKMLLNHTILIRNPTVTLSHTNGIPYGRQSHPSLLSLCQKDYGSLKKENETEAALVKASEPTLDSSVFSISGRRVVVSNGFTGNGNSKQLSNIKNPAITPNLPNEWSSRSSLDIMYKATDTKLQMCTDCFSLCLFVPGTVLCILSPWLLVPIYIIPSFSGSHLQTLIWISCVGSAILVIMGCMVGNVVWYRKGSKYKCRLHCGKGPKDHYWGDSLTSKRTVHTV